MILLILTTLYYLGIAKTQDMPKIPDLTGKTFGRLTIISQFKKIRPNGQNRSYAKCICSCGNEALTAIDKLISGWTQSCGCLRLEKTTRHGLNKHPLYKRWEGIKDRCYNENSKAYHRYGGRGIVMHPDWKHNPENFIKWGIDNGWSIGLTIERIDNDGDYEPSNCEWIPFNEQQKNTSTCMRIPYKGNIYTQNSLCKTFGIRNGTLRFRLKSGWSLEDAINTPPKVKRQNFNT